MRWILIAIALGLVCWPQLEAQEKWNFDYEKHLAENKMPQLSPGYLIFVLVTITGGIVAVIAAAKRLSPNAAGIHSVTDS